MIVQNPTYPGAVDAFKACGAKVIGLNFDHGTMIDELEKMGFVAGVCKGQIMGYEMAGCITTRQAEQLTNYLYAK